MLVLRRNLKGSDKLSKITLKQGNCFDYLNQIPSNSVDLVLTDPPYLISKKSNFDKGGAWNNATDARCRKTPPKTEFGEWDKKEFDIDTAIAECYRILKPSGSIIMFFDIWKMQELKEIMESHKFKQFRLCRWDKTNPVPVNSKLNYLSNTTEYFITAVKGGKPTFNSEYDKGIYTYPICSGAERTEHPTQKPLILIDELVKKHSNEGDLIIDPFMGSGTTGVSAKKFNRSFLGIELEENYFQIAKNRIDTA